MIGVRTAVEGLIRLHGLDAHRLGADRAVLFPGLSATAAEMIASVERVGERRRLGEISVAVDPEIAPIVASWPTHLDARRAIELGIPRDSDLDGIARAYLADEGLA